MSSRILLVEDDAGLVFSLHRRLTREGYAVEVAGNGDEGFERATREHFDLVILDVMLPGRRGYDVCRDLRARGVSAPILMLTARRQISDKVAGLKLGADDYLTKPFGMTELLARIEALLRRSRSSVSGGLRRCDFGDVSVDLDRMTVTRRGHPVELSSTEFELLRAFIRHSGLILTRSQLLTEVWGYNLPPMTRTVDAHVKSLRQKLEPLPDKPRYILTIHGYGYRFVGSRTRSS